LDALGLKENRHDEFLTEIKKEAISHNQGFKDYDEFLPYILGIVKVIVNLFEMSLQKCIRPLLSQDLTLLSVMKVTVSKIVTLLFHKH